MNETEIHTATDVCALPLVRRLAAMLDRDPLALREGDWLPRGWHPLLFNVPTRQSELRPDGTVDLGVPLPDIGLPRLMLGGRQVRFAGEIPIGAKLRRESRHGEVQLKEGRSGRFALVQVEHRIFVEGESQTVLVERQDYVLRAAIQGPATAPAAAAIAPVVATTNRTNNPTASGTLIVDECLLFRYSAITDNPHRIHYDLPYASQQEGYPALVVNGSIPAMFLLEMFRQHAGREPASFNSRNVAPMFGGQPLVLKLLNEGDAWRLWVEDAQGRITFDAQAE